MVMHKMIYLKACLPGIFFGFLGGMLGNIVQGLIDPNLGGDSLGQILGAGIMTSFFWVWVIRNDLDLRYFRVDNQD